jgi:hypothetical protein
VFNRLNGKKYHHTPAALLQVDLQPKEGFTSAHQENVKFIYEGKGVRDHRNTIYRMDQAPQTLAI